MSDSELSDAQGAIPDAGTIDSTLRRIVRDAISNDAEITIKTARTRAEIELGLDADFFKNDGEWKERSKKVISAAVDEEPESPVKAKKPAVVKKKPVAKAAAGRKRKSEEVEPEPKKRARKEPVVESEDDEEEEEEEEPKPKPQARKRKPAARDTVVGSDEDIDYDAEEQSKPIAKSRKASASRIQDDVDEEDHEAVARTKTATSTTVKADSEDESALSDPPKESSNEPETSKSNGKPATTVEEDDDSDLSSLIDEPPAKKKRQKKSTSPAASKKSMATKKAAASKTKPSTAKDLSPDDEEIKRLQGWLIKCGLRKLWHKELAPYDTSKAKISHLKAMLTDVGMTGRYSVEKARQIKEARELKEEIEAAKEFNDQWGKEGEGSGDDEEGSEKEVVEAKKRPAGRALPKGLVDFGDSGDDGSD